MPDVPAPRTYRGDIQGLRGIAVALVVLFHASLPGLGGGYVGVDVFFVISGFLITAHLLASLEETGRIDIPGFFARRARRILPASFAVLCATVVAAFFVVSPLRLEQVLRDAIATAVYIPNVAFAEQQTDYLHGTEPSPFQHYWSLGVEEQFYLLWPAVLIMVTLLVRSRRRRALTVAIAAIVLLSFVSCLVSANQSQPWAFFSLTTRAWELAIGGLLAATVRYVDRVAPAVAAIGGWLGLAAIVASGFLITAATPSPGFSTAVPVLGAAAVIWFGAGSGVGGPMRVLSARPLVFLGLISYSLYLVHWPLRVLTEDALGTPMPLWMSLGLAALAVPIAWVVYRFIEKPARDGALRRRPARSTLVGTLGVSSVILVVLVGAIPAAATLPLDSGRPAAETPLEVSPTGTPFVPSNLEPSLADAVADTGALYQGCEQTISRAEVVTCEFGDTSSRFTMALFGDSHAGRWFPALRRVAEHAHVRLVTYVKSGCRTEDTDDAWASTASASCVAWRAGALADLARHPPDLLIVANHTGPSPHQNPARVQRLWQQGIASSLKRLPPTSRVVTLADSPGFPTSPVLCLSAHLTDADRCAVRRSDAFNTAIGAAQATEAARLGTGYVDLSDRFCNAETCPAIIGAGLVYSDEHHLTATFSEKLAPALELALGRYLPAADSG